ncbi:MAG: DUF1492 domain-containing protein [Clostridiales bacterium]|nr:DUF1492 domain-containing protein [Clostridiales bacterium]
MTAKEFLSQAERLDRRLEIEIKRAQSFRRDAYSLGSPSIGERVQTSRNTDAPFERSVNEAIDMEIKIKDRIALLLKLKVQIQTAIDALDDSDERMVLYYRYVESRTWEEIGEYLNVNRTTVYRWHNRALEKIVIPENPVIL